MGLFKNYLTVSVRDMRRHPLFSSINLFGLAVGFTVLLMVLQYVLYETGFDQSNHQYESIYRVINSRYQNGHLIQRGAITYPTIGPALMEDYPEVEAYTRLTVGGRNYLHFQEEQFLLEDYVYADENFFNVFDYQLIEGNERDPLSGSGQVVLTKTYAERLLGKDEVLHDLIGREVRINDWAFTCTISAIVEDMPDQSHFQEEAFISYKTFIRLACEGADNSWQWSDFYHYVVLTEGSDEDSFNQKLIDFADRYFQDGEVSGSVEKFQLQPLRELHLDNSQEYEYAQVIDGKYLGLILAIALIIMAIAWINYINLTTSRALDRAKEVAVRKVLGAFRNQVFAQFLVESFLFNFSGLLLALIATWLLQPVFDDWTNVSMGLELFVTSYVFGVRFLWLFLSGFVLVVFVIGVYPAHVFSLFKPAEVTKGKYQLEGGLVYLRKVLVTVQFVAALTLIASSIAVYRQIGFMRSQDLGMDMKNNLVLYGPDLTHFDSVYIAKFESFRSELMSDPSVVSVTSTGRLFGDKMPRAFQLQSSGDPDHMVFASNWLPVDRQFLDQFGIEVLAGRGFDAMDYHTDGGQVQTAMLNEAALSQFNFKSAEEAIGGRVVNVQSNRSYRIVGVVTDFHQRTMKEAIEPIVFFPFHDNSHFISIKYLGGKEEEVVSAASKVFAQFYPGNYFDYLFLEDYYHANYLMDERVGAFSAGLTIIAVVLATLGLYGLVLMTLKKKVKEIGIRKVLGASLSQLLLGFGAQFMLLVAVAMLIGMAGSYWAIGYFMQGYSYNIGVELWVIFSAALLILLMSLATVMLHTNRISRNNPVDSLRCE